jgi:pilus assembly protein CpaE
LIQKADILLVGRTTDSLSEVAQLLAGNRSLTIGTRIVANGHSDPIPSGENGPDVVLLCLSNEWESDFAFLSMVLPDQKPPIIVVSPVIEIGLLKSSMHAGARDVMQLPMEPDDLVSKVLELAQEAQAKTSDHSAHLIAFMNAKGGSGASVLAANVAATIAKRHIRRAMLLDFDVQFASQPSYLNLGANNGLINALESAETLDEASIKGYSQIHKCGLHLLAAAPSGLVSPDEIAQERVESLLDVLDKAFDNVVVDLPRRIDAITTTILARVDKIVVVTQQSVSHLHDTKRLLTILHRFVGLPDDRMVIAINRFDKKSDVRRSDFEEAFPGVEIVQIPGDYRRVAESVNLGVPLVEHGEKTPISKAIVNLSERTAGGDVAASKKASKMLKWLGVS